MLRLNCLELELFYLTNNTLLPNGKNKQRKLIQHVLILSTRHSLIKKTCQWLEAKTNLQSSLDWKFIFTGTDNWSEVQHKVTAKTWVKNVHRLYDHKQLASQQLITQLENTGVEQTDLLLADLGPRGREEGGIRWESYHLLVRLGSHQALVFYPLVLLPFLLDTCKIFRMNMIWLENL